MNRPLIKLLENRLQLARGSLALVDKQLVEVAAALDNEYSKLYDEPIRGEEEKSDTDFFISPPLSVYEGDE